MKTVVATCALVFLFLSTSGQAIYTAEGYWNESNKESYKLLKTKLEKGDSLTVDERAYLTDFENYLQTYFNRLPENEKQRYLEMKPQWEGKKEAPPKSIQDDFEWRNRDRFLNAMYGIYYGTSLMVMTDAGGGAAAGIPLITGGIALLGPAINPKRYDGITQSTIRASHSGKFLGLGYGAALGLALTPANGDSPDLILGLSSLGSLVLGEVAFQTQKKYKTPDGKIELMRHYGVLTPLVGLSLYGATTDGQSSNLAGLSLLGGGVAGLLIANKAYGNYDYSRGDVSAVTSLSLIATGLGFSFVINALENENGSRGLFLVPAASAIAGTLIAQRRVKGLYLTRKQGSTISLATSGAALIGFGLMAITETESPTAIIAVPTVLSLIVHQSLFSKYKRESLMKTMKADLGKKKKSELAFRVMPENYLLNRQLPAARVYNPALPATNPIVNLSWRFK